MEFTGSWWRHSEYEIRDGNIAPTSDAELTIYDPWQSYGSVRGVMTPNASPYGELLNLYRSVRDEIGPDMDPAELSTESQLEILNWCRRFGLLGVLPHRCHFVELAPRWRPFPGTESQGRTTKNGKRELLLFPTMRRYLRHGYGWSGRNHGVPPLANRMDATYEGQLVSSEDYPEMWPEPGAVFSDPNSKSWNHRPLASSWKMFFPSVPKNEGETYAYPLPLSDEFWPLYAEPVSAFLEAAAGLHSALHKLRRREASNESVAQYRARIVDGQESLNGLAASVSPSLALQGNGRFRQTWISTSLLGSISMMAVIDLAGNGRVLTCPVCHGLFTSLSSKTKYCSPTCRNTENKRKFRKKQRKTKLLSQAKDQKLPS